MPSFSSSSCLPDIGRPASRECFTSSANSSEAWRQACRYLVKDFGTSESPKSTRQRDSRYAPT
ncbi:MAG: hypothetical protein KZQ65_10595, partial [Candidatus Thiodiazotropha sp. (ex Gloverina cf. vestifex)]|nr:hypothetical protein [Candidatus Thiodiazotropha sp. (ex Gloverina cf. vestifex)]